MSGFLRLADPEAVVRVNHDGGDWVDLRASLSKRQVNSILSTLPSEVFERAGEARFSFNSVMSTAEALFSSLVVGWSLDAPPTIDNYLNLEGEAAGWLDGVLYKHFDDIQLSKDDAKKPSNSASGSRTATE